MAKTQQKCKILRGGKNTQEELYKKGLNDLDNHDGMVTHLEPDILECEIKWALEILHALWRGRPAPRGQGGLCPLPTPAASSLGEGTCTISFTALTGPVKQEEEKQAQRSCREVAQDCVDNK